VRTTRGSAKAVWVKSLLPLAGARGNDVADAATGVWHVTGVTRDDVEMELRMVVDLAKAT